MKLKLLLSFALFSLGTFTFAQEKTGENLTLITTHNNVSVYYEQGKCSATDVVFIRIVNNNTKPVQINWTLWEGEQSKNLEVQPGETITGTCQNRPRVSLLTDMVPAGKTAKDMHPVFNINVQP